MCVSFQEEKKNTSWIHMFCLCWCLKHQRRSVIPVWGQNRHSTGGWFGDGGGVAQAVCKAFFSHSHPEPSPEGVMSPLVIHTGESVNLSERLRSQAERASRGGGLCVCQTHLRPSFLSGQRRYQFTGSISHNDTANLRRPEANVCVSSGSHLGVPRL